MAAATEDASLGGLLRARWEAFKGGDVGSAPVIVGVIAITIFFTSKSSIFFTAVNFSNLIQQMAGVTVIAIGVVFVLLIGEIDLSIGYVSGLAGVIVAELQVPGSSHDYPGLIALAAAIGAGAAIGALQGSFVALIGVPSFVVTLAGLLIWQGVILKALVRGRDRDPGPPDQRRRELRADEEHGLDRGDRVLGRLRARRLRHLSEPQARRAAGRQRDRRDRAGCVLRGLAFAAVAVCNHYRGVPLVGLIVLFLTVLGAYVAGRTTFGRHVYAVGGNAEAARRAGINVKLIRIFVFMISGSMAAMGGIIFASRLNSVDLTAGGGTILLDSISAAVIGGVSLFGGRGRVSGALFGGLIIGMIANGIDLVGYTDAVKFITTGVILLAAVTLDTVARRRQAAAGR